MESEDLRATVELRTREGFIQALSEPGKQRAERAAILNLVRAHLHRSRERRAFDRGALIERDVNHFVRVTVDPAPACEVDLRWSRGVFDNPQVIQKRIKHKERDLLKYRQNVGAAIWLLLVAKDDLASLVTPHVASKFPFRFSFDRAFLHDRSQGAIFELRRDDA